MKPSTLFAAVAAAILVTGLVAAAGWSLAGPALQAAAIGHAGLLGLLPLAAAAAVMLLARRRRRRGKPS